MNLHLPWLAVQFAIIVPAFLSSLTLAYFLVRRVHSGIVRQFAWGVGFYLMLMVLLPFLLPPSMEKHFQAFVSSITVGCMAGLSRAILGKGLFSDTKSSEL